jgi:acetyl-CoA carboxylase carboxyl transferase subunit alpha
MGITAERLASLKLVDEVLTEPLGGAHRDPEAMAQTLRAALLRHLGDLGSLTAAQLVAERGKRLADFGVYTETKV